MNSDLTEQRLRERLQAVVDGEAGSYLDIDPLAALETGRRVLRRRRLTAVAGTAAAALVIGIGGWAVLSDSTADDRTMPAVTSSVTGPSVTLPLGIDPEADTAGPLDVVVTVGQGQPQVEFRLQTDAGEVLNAQVRNEADGQVTWATLSDRAIVAVVPAGAVGFVPRCEGGDIIPLATASERLPDGRIAAAWLAEKSDVGRRCQGPLWTDGTSTFNAAGQTLSSITVDDIVIFTGAGVSLGDAIGYIRPEPGSLSGSGEIRPRGDALPFAKFPSVWVPDRSGDGGVYAAYLPYLPAGDEKAREQITVETTSGATIRDVETYVVSEMVFVVAHVDGSPSSVTGVSYPGSEDTAGAPGN
jgi:hypothetical protein